MSRQELPAALDEAEELLYDFPGPLIDFMSNEIGGISLALWGGLSICALTVLMAWLYARRAGEWERMAQRVVERA